jgi:preprotein translocase subunit YajC
MGEQSDTLAEFIKSKQMLAFFIFMVIVSVLFHPILSRRQRKALQLQEAIKKTNMNKLKNFGGTSLERVQ